MTRNPAYFDVRSSFWRSCFDKASEYGRYLADSSPAHAKRWRDRSERGPRLTDEQMQRLSGHSRALNVLLVSGAWCGDCARQGPMIKQIVDASSDEVRMRVIDRDLDPLLRDELRIMGAMRVPVVVFLTEDFFEVARFGDQTLTSYRKGVAVESREGSSKSYRSPEDESAAELEEWVCLFERALLMVRSSPFLRRRYGD